MSDASHLYSIFGLTVRSEIAFDGLPPAGEKAVPDVEIRRGAIVAAEDRPGYRETPHGTLLTVPGTGRYLISGGREIVAEAAEGGSERNLRLYLLGSAIGALLHQRGLLPLHANAIEIGGRAFAFSGHSGAGKSTMAAWFHDRGHRILTDDVCVIATTPDGRALAYPGIPRLRLWREAVEASGRKAEEYDRSFDGMDKFDVPTRMEERRDPLELGGVYLLRRAEDGAQAGRIERIAGAGAVETLISNTYRGGYLRTIGRTGEHFHACLGIARAVPVFRVERLWGFDRFEEQARMLESHALSLPRPGAAAAAADAR
ncbi:MAG: hypothetical protein ACK40O_11835 [Allosphingosinicella sp.]